MNKIMSDLYTFTTDRISVTPGYQEKIRALAIAKMAVINELQQETEKELVSLLDVYASLDGERQELREQMVFQSAFELGMELGRLGIRS